MSRGGRGTACGWRSCLHGCWLRGRPGAPPWSSGQREGGPGRNALPGGFPQHGGHPALLESVRGVRRNTVSDPGGLPEVSRAHCFLPESGVFLPGRTSQLPPAFKLVPPWFYARLPGPQGDQHHSVMFVSSTAWGRGSLGRKDGPHDTPPSGAVSLAGGGCSDSLPVASSVPALSSGHGTLDLCARARPLSQCRAVPPSTGPQGQARVHRNLENVLRMGTLQSSGR